MARVDTRVCLILDARLHRGDLKSMLACLDNEPTVKKLKERDVVGPGEIEQLATSHTYASMWSCAADASETGFRACAAHQDRL